MINKDVCKFLARKNENNIIIWSWNNPKGKDGQAQIQIIYTAAKEHGT